MSWLSQLTGIHLGNIGAPVGAALGSVIPGVGTALGAGLGQAIGGIGHGDSVGSSLAQGAGAYGGAKLLGAAASKFGGSGGGVPGDGDSGSSGSSGGILGAITSHLPSAAGIGQFLSHNAGGLSGLASTGLLAAQGLNAANLGKKSTDFANQAMDSVNQSYNDRAPLRAQGLAGLLHPKAPDMGNLQQIAGTSPYAPKPMALPRAG